jgi:hypothetical protein
MANLRDFLLPKQPVAFDAPTRNDPPLNQGGKPSGPQRLTGREFRKIQQFATGTGPSIQRVIELNRFPSIITVPFSLTTAGIAGAQLPVPAPDRDRIFLAFRNAAGSAGTLFIGFSGKPDANTAVFSLVAGGQLILDVVIPQDDVWIATDTATTFGTVAYANSEFVL